MASLLADRRFAPLFWCQFLAAFGDNALKSALVFVLVWGRGGQQAAALVTLAGAVFIAPFFLLSGLGGEIADRFDKAIVARRIKLFELVAALLAALGVGFGNVRLLFAALTAFGVASALFGPVKYGILPDQLAPSRLPAANALVEAATFAAILAGTVAGGLATSVPGTLAGAIATCSVLAWIAACLIPPTRRGMPALAIRANILASAAALIHTLRASARLWRAALFNAWFWLAGSIALALLPTLIKDTLGGNEAAATLALGLFAVGTGLGSALAALLAAKWNLLAPCPIGAALVGATLLDLWWTVRRAMPAPTATFRLFLAQPGRAHTLVDLMAIALAGSLIAVPSFTALQTWAAPEQRARCVAGVNVLSAGAIVAGALAIALLQHRGVGAPTLLAYLGTASLAVAALMALGLREGTTRSRPDPCGDAEP